MQQNYVKIYIARGYRRAGDDPRDYISGSKSQRYVGVWVVLFCKGNSHSTATACSEKEKTLLSRNRKRRFYKLTVRNVRLCHFLPRSCFYGCVRLYHCTVSSVLDIAGSTKRMFAQAGGGEYCARKAMALQ